MISPKAVYIHIPFCATKCHYCDFTAYLVEGQPVDDYLSALEQEISMTVAENPSGKLTSIFIGGGTPTVLNPAQMHRILSVLEQYFPDRCVDMEFTIEANPGTTTDELLEVMRAGGVNRLSFGAQTFEPHLLREIGRSHGVDEIASSVHKARNAGFQNISLDLMFGLPKQTVEQMKETLIQAVRLQPDHFSCYSLKVEEGTLFHYLEQRGQLPLPSEETEFKMYQLIRSYLQDHDYEQYEVSNFAKNGFRSRHNSTYWQNEPYYGMGAGAYGYVNGVRHANVRGISEYIGRLMDGQRPVLHQEDISIHEQMENFFILGLRLRRGVNLAKFEQLYERSAENVFGKVIHDLMKRNLLQRDGLHLKLTEQGLLFGNDVFSRFLS